MKARFILLVLTMFCTFSVGYSSQPDEILSIDVDGIHCFAGHIDNDIQAISVDVVDISASFTTYDALRIESDQAFNVYVEQKDTEDKPPGYTSIEGLTNNDYLFFNEGFT